MIVCVAAAPAIDRLITVQRLEPGAIHRPLEVVAVPGGKGLNVARAAATLGAQVSVVALLAGHAGRWIDDALRAEGIERRIIWTDGETRTCLSVADRQTERLTQFYETANAAGATGWSGLAAMVDQAVAAIGTGAEQHWLTISGSMPADAPPDGYAALIASARRAGLGCALDTSGPNLQHSLDAQPDIIKINAAEASDVLESPCGTHVDVLLAAKDLRRRAGGDGHCAIITRGPQGAVCVAPDGSAWRGRLAVNGAYPVGSGDAFLAGLVHGLERNNAWPLALALALGAAGANAEVPGAGRLLRERAAVLAKLANVLPALPTC